MIDSDQVLAFQNSNKSYYLPILLDFYQKYNCITTGQIIDLGCGTADLDILLSKKYPNLTITGYDGSPSMIEMAQNNVTIQNASVNLKCCEFNVVNDKADLVISTNTLHHIHNPQVFWSAIKSISNNVFVVDMIRPISKLQAEQVVERFTADADPWYREDFYNSLLASFTANELQDQISNTKLNLDVHGDPGLLQIAVIYGNIN